ncbi:hypothetical protein, partial [Stutzerimonas nitrititolerans]|uniref:hypothetical protein n=1 Tax=Stutzerimonas nitrititolerans TaxID=2482751 RepID=UPI0028A219A1
IVFVLETAHQKGSSLTRSQTGKGQHGSELEDAHNLSMANEMAVQLDASIVCSQAAGRSCDAAYEQGKWSQVAQVHDSWEVMSELITARTDLILISAAAKKAFQLGVHSTVTDLARLRGWSTSVPRSTAT